MARSDRVLKGLECCAHRSDEMVDPYRHIPKSCKSCPFYFPEHAMDCTERLARETLTYVKQLNSDFEKLVKERLFD